MKPLLPEEPFYDLGIPGQTAIKGLLYNSASGCLVAIAHRQLELGPAVYRLYYRRLPAETYEPVGLRHELEDQSDVFSCEGSPFLIFNELRFRAELVPNYPEWMIPLLPKGQAEARGYGADWIGIRRFNLDTAEDKRVLDEETINPFPPYTRAWVSQLLSVSPDGTGCVCVAALTKGGKVDRFVCEASFTEGLKRQLAPLKRVFL